MFNTSSVVAVPATIATATTTITTTGEEWTSMTLNYIYIVCVSVYVCVRV